MKMNSNGRIVGFDDKVERDFQLLKKNSPMKIVSSLMSNVALIFNKKSRRNKLKKIINKLD